MDHAALTSFPGPMANPSEAKPEARDLCSLAHAELVPGDMAALVRLSIEAGRDPGPEFFERLGKMFEIANSQFFQVDLFNPIDVEVIGIAHIRRRDLLPGHDIGATTRKLALALPVVVATADGTSAACLAQVSKRVEVRVGTAVVYPAFAPVIFDLNSDQHVEAIVAFAHGPRYR